MNLSLAFWIVFLIAFIFGLWSNRADFRAGAPGLIVYLLIFLLGWAVFGPPIKG